MNRSSFANVLRATVSSSALALCVPLFVNSVQAGGALPSGGQYTAGKGAIGGSAAALVVKQSSTTGIIDWNGFSVGKGSSVTFDNGSGATLNEVTGGNPSTIAGSLHASGSVYLIDPEGVIVSGSGRIITGGSFVASTGGDTKRGVIVDAGTIRSARGNVRLSGSNVSVSGSIAVMRGGQLWLTSSGTTSVSGTLDADNARGPGGTIVVTGKTVDVAGTADIAASGTSKGGTILIGGDVHGGAVAADNFVHSNVATAQTTSVAQGATISANASAGAGGAIVIWSDDHTSFAGAISAKGETAGGFAEISSHDLLAFTGTANLTARGGEVGTLLLDPENVAINDGGDVNVTCSGDLCTPTGDNSNISVTTLENALATTRVEVTTGSTGSQAGNIQINSELSWTSGNSLVLDAAGWIAIPGSIHGPNAIVDLIAGGTILQDGGSLTARVLEASSSGAITMTAPNTIDVLGAITTGGGDFSLTDYHALAVNGVVNAGAGNVTITANFTGNTLGIQNAITGATVDLVSTGIITSTSNGIITAATLTGSSIGRTTLIAANQITDLGAFSTGNGELEFTNAAPLTVTGAVDSGTGTLVLTTTGAGDALTIDAALTGGTAAGTKVDLVSAGAIASDGSGVITTNELAASSSGNIALNAANAISVLAVVTTDDGDFSLTDAQTLAIDAALNAGSGSVTLTTTGTNDKIGIQAPLTGETIDFISASSISSNSAGVVTATEVEGSSVGTLSLNAANTIADLGAFTTDNGYFSLTTTAPLTVTGAVDAGIRNITLTTTGTNANLAIQAPLTGATIDLVSTGTIANTGGGILTANIVTGSSAGNVVLDGTNLVHELGSFTTGNGDFTFTDGYVLTVSGAVNAGTGNIALTTYATQSGVNQLENDMYLDAPLTGDHVDLISSGTLSSNASGAITAGVVTGSANNITNLDSGANQITDLGPFTMDGGLFLTDARSLTVTGTLNGTSQSGSFSLTTTGTNSNLTIAAPVTATSGVELVSAGTLGQDAAGIITTQYFGGSSVGAATFDAANDVAVLYGLTTSNANFSFMNTAALEAGGAVNAGTGTVTITTTGASSNIFLRTAIVGGTVNLNSGGNITQSDAAYSYVTANLLNVTADTGITLDSPTNNITTIGTDHTNSGPNIIDKH